MATPASAPRSGLCSWITKCFSSRPSQKIESEDENSCDDLIFQIVIREEIGERRKAIATKTREIKNLDAECKALANERAAIEGLLTLPPAALRTNSAFIQFVKPKVDAENQRRALEQLELKQRELAAAQEQKDALDAFRARRGYSTDPFFGTQNRRGLAERSPATEPFGIGSLYPSFEPRTASLSPAAAAALEIENNYKNLRFPTGNIEDARWRTEETSPHGGKIRHCEQVFIALLQAYPDALRPAILAALSPAMKAQLPNLFSSTQ